jgi:hypothetical protein
MQALLRPPRLADDLVGLPLADMEGPAVKRFVTAPSISSSMSTSEPWAGEQG